MDIIKLEKVRSFQNVNLGVGLQIIREQVDEYKVFFLLFFLFFFISCSKQEEYKAPDCSNRKLSIEELKQKKDDLFRDIENSTLYANDKLREEAILRYKYLITTAQKTYCSDEVERLINGIAKLHKK